MRKAFGLSDSTVQFFYDYLLLDSPKGKSSKILDRKLDGAQAKDLEAPQAEEGVTAGPKDHKVQGSEVVAYVFNNFSRYKPALQKYFSDKKIGFDLSWLGNDGRMSPEHLQATERVLLGSGPKGLMQEAAVRDIQVSQKDFTESFIRLALRKTEFSLLTYIDQKAVLSRLASQLLQGGQSKDPELEKKFHAELARQHRGGRTLPKVVAQAALLKGMDLEERVQELKKEGRTEEALLLKKSARRLYQAAVELDGQNPLARRKLAGFLFGEGKKIEAGLHLGIAAQFETSREAMFDIATLIQKNGPAEMLGKSRDPWAFLGGKLLEIKRHADAAAVFHRGAQEATSRGDHELSLHLSEAELLADERARPYELTFDAKTQIVAHSLYEHLKAQGVASASIDGACLKDEGKTDRKISAEEVFAYLDQHLAEAPVQAALKSAGLDHIPWQDHHGKVRKEFANPEFQRLSFTQKLAAYHAFRAKESTGESVEYHLKYAGLFEPGNAEWDQRRGEYFLVQGNLPKTSEILQTAQAKDPTREALKLPLAKLAAAQGDETKAIELYRDYLKTHAKDGEAKAGMEKVQSAYLQKISKRFDEKQVVYRASLGPKPEDAEAQWAEMGKLIATLQSLQPQNDEETWERLSRIQAYQKSSIETRSSRRPRILNSEEYKKAGAEIETFRSQLKETEASIREFRKQELEPKLLDTAHSDSARSALQLAVKADRALGDPSLLREDLGRGMRILETTPAAVLTKQERLDQWGVILRAFSEKTETVTGVPGAELSLPQKKDILARLSQDCAKTLKPNEAESLSRILKEIEGSDDPRRISILGASLSKYLQATQTADQAFAEAKAMSKLPERRSALLAVMSQYVALRDASRVESVAKEIEGTLPKDAKDAQVLEMWTGLALTLKGSGLPLEAKVRENGKTQAQSMASGDQDLPSRLERKLCVKSFYEAAGMLAELETTVKELRQGRDDAFNALLIGAPKDGIGKSGEPKTRVELASLATQLDLELLNSDLAELAKSPDKPPAIFSALPARLEVFRKEIEKAQGEPPEFSLKHLAKLSQALAAYGNLAKGSKPLIAQAELDKVGEAMKPLLTKSVDELVIPSGKLSPSERALSGKISRDIQTRFLSAVKDGEVGWLGQVNNSSLLAFARTCGDAHRLLALSEGKKGRSALGLRLEAASKFGQVGLKDLVKESLGPVLEYAKARTQVDQQVPLIMGLADIFRNSGMAQEANDALQVLVVLGEGEAKPELKQISVLAQGLQAANLGDATKATECFLKIPDHPMAKLFLARAPIAAQQQRMLTALSMLRGISANFLESGRQAWFGGLSEQEFEEFQRDTTGAWDEVQRLVTSGEADTLQGAISQVRREGRYPKFRTGFAASDGYKNIYEADLSEQHVASNTGDFLINGLDPLTSDQAFLQAGFNLAGALTADNYYGAAGQIYSVLAQNPAVASIAKERLDGLPTEAKVRAAISTVWNIASFAAGPAGIIAANSTSGAMGAGYAENIAMSLVPFGIARGFALGAEGFYAARAASLIKNPALFKLGGFVVSKGAEAAGFTLGNMAMTSLIKGTHEQWSWGNFGKDWLNMFVTFTLLHGAGMALSGLGRMSSRGLARAEAQLQQALESGKGIEAATQRLRMATAAEKIAHSGITAWGVRVSSFVGSDLILETIGLKESEPGLGLGARAFLAAATDLQMSVAGKTVDVLSRSRLSKLEKSTQEKYLHHEIRYESERLDGTLKEMGFDPKGDPLAYQMALKSLLTSRFNGESFADLKSRLGKEELKDLRYIVRNNFGKDPESPEGKRFLALLLGYAQNHPFAAPGKPLTFPELFRATSELRFSVAHLLIAAGVDHPATGARLGDTALRLALEHGLTAQSFEKFAAQGDKLKMSLRDTVEKIFGEGYTEGGLGQALVGELLLQGSFNAESPEKMIEALHSLGRPEISERLSAVRKKLVSELGDDAGSHLIVQFFVQSIRTTGSAEEIPAEFARCKGPVLESAKALSVLADTLLRKQGSYHTDQGQVLMGELLRTALSSGIDLAELPQQLEAMKMLAPELAKLSSDARIQSAKELNSLVRWALEEGLDAKEVREIRAQIASHEIELAIEKGEVQINPIHKLTKVKSQKPVFADLLQEAKATEAQKLAQEAEKKKAEADSQPKPVAKEEVKTEEPKREPTLQIQVPQDALSKARELKQVRGEYLSLEALAEREAQLGIKRSEWEAEYAKDPKKFMERLKTIETTREQAALIIDEIFTGSDRAQVKRRVELNLKQAGVEISTDTSKAIDSMIDLVQTAKSANILGREGGLSYDQLGSLLTTLYLHQSPAVRIGAAELTHVPMVVKGILDNLRSINPLASVSEKRVAFVTALFHDAGKWDTSLRTESGFTILKHPFFNKSGREIVVKPGENLSEALARLQDPAQTPESERLSAEEAAKVTIPGFLIGVIAHHDSSSVHQMVTETLVTQGVLSQPEADATWRAIERHGWVSSWILANSFGGIGVFSHVFRDPDFARFSDLYRGLTQEMQQGKSIDLSSGSMDPRVAEVRKIFQEKFSPLEQAMLIGDHQGQIDIAKYMMILVKSPGNKTASVHQLLLGGDRVNSVDGVLVTHTSEQLLLLPKVAEKSARAFAAADGWLRNWDGNTPGLAKALLSDAKTSEAYLQWKAGQTEGEATVEAWLKSQRILGEDGNPTPLFLEVQRVVDKAFYAHYALEETRSEYEWAPPEESETKTTKFRTFLDDAKAKSYFPAAAHQPKAYEDLQGRAAGGDLPAMSGDIKSGLVVELQVEGRVEQLDFSKSDVVYLGSKAGWVDITISGQKVEPRHAEIALIKGKDGKLAYSLRPKGGFHVEVLDLQGDSHRVGPKGHILQAGETIKIGETLIPWPGPVRALKALPKTKPSPIDHGKKSGADDLTGAHRPKAISGGEGSPQKRVQPPPLPKANSLRHEVYKEHREQAQSECIQLTKLVETSGTENIPSLDKEGKPKVSKLWKASFGGAEIPNPRHLPAEADFQYFTEEVMAASFAENGGSLKEVPAARYEARLLGAQRLADTVARLRAQYKGRLESVDASGKAIDPSVQGNPAYFMLRNEHGRASVFIVLHQKPLAIPAAAEVRAELKRFLSEDLATLRDWSRETSIRDGYASRVLAMVGGKQDSKGEWSYGSRVEALLERMTSSSDPAERARAGEEVAMIFAYLRDVPQVKEEFGLLVEVQTLREDPLSGRAVYQKAREGDPRAEEALFALRDLSDQLKRLGENLGQETRDASGAILPESDKLKAYYAVEEKLHEAKSEVEKCRKEYQETHGPEEFSEISEDMVLSSVPGEAIVDETEESGEVTKPNRLLPKAPGSSGVLALGLGLGTLFTAETAHAADQASAATSDPSTMLIVGLGLTVAALTGAAAWAYRRYSGESRESPSRKPEKKSPPVDPKSTTPKGNSMRLKEDEQSYLRKFFSEPVVTEENVMSLIAAIRKRSKTHMAYGKGDFMQFVPDPVGREILKRAMIGFAGKIQREDPKLYAYLKEMFAAKTSKSLPPNQRKSDTEPVKRRTAQQKTPVPAEEDEEVTRTRFDLPTMRDTPTLPLHPVDKIGVEEMPDNSVLELVFSNGSQGNYDTPHAAVFIAADPTLEQPELFGVLVKKDGEVSFSPQVKGIQVFQANGAPKGLRGSTKPVRLAKGDSIVFKNELGTFQFSFDGRSLKPNVTLAMEGVPAKEAPAFTGMIIQDNEPGKPREGTLSAAARKDFGSFSAQTHQGVDYGTPDHNEDCLVQTENSWMVGDGMGGMLSSTGEHIGDKASALAGQTFYDLMSDPNYHGDLEGAMIEADNAIKASPYREGGSTAVAGRVFQKTDGSFAAKIVHVGDAGAMVFEPKGGGKLKLSYRTVEQSEAQEQRDQGRIPNTTLSMRISEFARMVTGGLGTSKPANPIPKEVPLEKGSWVVSYSDGIGDNVSEGELRQILESSVEAKEAQEKIVSLVLNKMQRLKQAKDFLRNPAQGGARLVEITDQSGVKHRCVELKDFPGAFIDPVGIKIPYVGNRGQGAVYDAQGQVIDRYKADNVAVHVYLHDVGTSNASPGIHDAKTVIMPAPKKPKK